MHYAARITPDGLAAGEQLILFEGKMADLQCAAVLVHAVPWLQYNL
jgi:hypothetical protein